MEEAEATRYRRLAARANFLASDRSDIQYAVKEACRRMAKQVKGDRKRIKKVGRYLKGRPRGVFQYVEQAMPTSIDIYMDSDHAGCTITRKTTGGFSADSGSHVVKTGSQIHSTSSLSSGESEFYKLVKGTSVGLAIQSLLKDWGIEVKVRI